MERLQKYGWEDSWKNLFSPYEQEQRIPARITREGKNLFHAASAAGDLLVEISGSLSYLVQLGVSEYPVVGDWCVIAPHGTNRGSIEAVLPRKSVLHRPVTREDGRTRKQGKAVAANIDLALILIDIAFDRSLRRAERFLTLLNSDAIPAVLILTKAGIAEHTEELAAAAKERFKQVPVLLTDSLTAQGIGDVQTYCPVGNTVIVLGASGAGKSSLINVLAAADLAKTSEVRGSDGEGRHTTTARQLFALQSGALLLDTPGIRAVGTWGTQETPSTTFSDITTYARRCRFSDCTHTSEPGCEVRKALKEGFIDRDSYENYLILKEETLGKEELIHRKREKEKDIARIKYHMRRTH
ncbi:MAG: ribosome small subunit-dependent GTPase A [Sphaerochaetaceae bacterium]|nr:ribosome small subunit-dependent GTPase A [Sphaerochaetaceae bacterium]